jgi:hypothetical protein
MAEKGMFEAFSKFSEYPFMSVEGAKKAAAWYIDTSEKFATQALDMQEKVAGWIKETPFAPVMEAQQKLARKLLERSVSTARSLWQLQGQN